MENLKSKFTVNYRICNDKTLGHWEELELEKPLTYIKNNLIDLEADKCVSSYIVF